jgi:hypothetical protein
MWSHDPAAQVFAIALALVSLTGLVLAIVFLSPLWALLFALSVVGAILS